MIARDYSPPCPPVRHHGCVPSSCAFCQIAAGLVPAPVVFQDERFLAFLDHRPLFPGHCLLIPRAHYETLPDLPVGDTGPLFERARLLCQAVEQATGGHGTFLAVNNRVSQSVPHLHVHIVPRRQKDGLRGFFWPRKKYRDDAELEETRAAIETAIGRLR
jgi:histidine triad (HIT) family protein